MSSVPWDTAQISWGKSNSLRRTPAGFTAMALDGYGLCDFLPARPTMTASYPVSVRQAAPLIHASFRLFLTVQPLRFSSTSPPSGCARDFHPQAAGHAQHTGCPSGTALGGFGLDKDMPSDLCCHHEFNGRMWLILRQMLCQIFPWRQIYADSDRRSHFLPYERGRALRAVFLRVSANLPQDDLPALARASRFHWSPSSGYHQRAGSERRDQRCAGRARDRRKGAERRPG